jgi:hypothetical protein
MLTINLHRLPNNDFGIEFEDQCLILTPGADYYRGAKIFTDFDIYGLEIIYPESAIRFQNAPGVGVYTCDLNHGNGTYLVHLAQMSGVICHG